MKKIFLFISFIFAISNIYSQENSARDFRLFGHVYLRPTLDGRDFSNSTHPLFFTLQRVSVGVEKELFQDVSVTAEFMDSRIWGQTQNVRKSITNVDLHQGFVSIKNIFNKPLDLKVGRFEAAFNKKIIGIVGWQDVPVAYDGFDLTYRFNDKFNCDFFFIHPYNSSNYIPVPTIGYPDPANPDPGYYAPGFTAKYNFSKGFFVQPIVLHESQGKTANTVELTKTTAALDIGYKEQSYDLWFHAGMQTGNIGTKDISSFGFLAYLGYSFGFVKPMIIVDINSGTEISEQAENNNLYWNNFGERHMFFGHGDYFGNMPVATKGLGLNEFALRLIFNEGKIFSANLEAHIYSTNVPNANDETDLGKEFDLIFKYQMNSKSYIDAGFVAFMPGEISKSLYTPQNRPLHEDIGFFSYLRFWFAF